MNGIASLTTAVALSVATMLFAIPAVAQVQETPVTGQRVSIKGDAMPALSLAEVEAALEAASGIEDSAKDLLRTKYKQAIKALQEADSSLNLVLRAYLPDLDNRMGTITDLLTELSQRFAAAGIEIAFPQRDVYIRKGSESAPLLASPNISTVRRQR